MNTSALHFCVMLSKMHHGNPGTCGRPKKRLSIFSAHRLQQLPRPDLPAGSKIKYGISLRKHRAGSYRNCSTGSARRPRPISPAAAWPTQADPLTMPRPCSKAHQKLDAAVDKAFTNCGGSIKSDAERVAFLERASAPSPACYPADKPMKRTPRSTP